MQEYTVKVLRPDSGRRLDLFLPDFFKNKGITVSRHFLQKLIQQGDVTKCGLTLKPHYKIKSGDEFKIQFLPQEKGLPQPENIPLEIIYEDDCLAVINKPPGLVVHPGAGNYAHTLVNVLLYHFKKLSDIHPQRPGIIHRLDKETSGLLVIAKDNSSHLALARQFSEHSIRREYIALVKGKMEFDEGEIELPIGRHPRKRRNMSVGFGKKTRYAKTCYRTLKRTEEFSLVELEPFTGRTHQLRVHLAFLGHPILGDNKYGKNNPFSRLALHAQRLGFRHPATGKTVEFFCPAPSEFLEFMSAKKP